MSTKKDKKPAAKNNKEVPDNADEETGEVEPKEVEEEETFGDKCAAGIKFVVKVSTNK